MKYSIYNSVIPIDKENSLLYNANSDKFLILTRKAKEEIDKGLEYLTRENASLLQNLCEVSAVVPAGVNEIVELQNKIKKVLEDDTCFELHINPTLDCNFNCWYCYEDHIKGSFMSKETLDSTKKFISKTLDKRGLKRFHLSFFGGEPLLYFKRIALPLIQYTLDRCVAKNIEFSSHFTSNGFLISDYTLKNIEGINVDFQITLDGDEVRHNKTRFLSGGKGSYEVICKNIKALAKQKHNVCLRINYTQQNIQCMSSILRSFEDAPQDVKKYINVDFQRVWQDSDSDSGTADSLNSVLHKLIKEFSNAGFSCSFHKVQNNVVYPCYGDKKNNLLINYDGKVFSCTARNFTSENSVGTLLSNGEISWKEHIIEQRRSSKFSRTECHRCIIAPICGGSCTQNAIEKSNVSGCLRGLSEEDKKPVILDRFEFMFLNNDY